VRAGVIHHASSVRPPKSLVVRAGLVRTFGSLAGFVVVTFLCGGLYILEDALANPIEAGASAVISAAFIITLAAMLLFFLVKPSTRSRTTSHARDFDSRAPAARPFLSPAARGVRQDNLRNNLAYQRFYVDHSRIRP
jgi:hypothetical protein